MEGEEAKKEEASQDEQTQKVNEKLRRSCFFYYLRKDVQQGLLNFSKNREVVPSYKGGFGKRPDMLQYPSDVKNLVMKGATSFHCSEELWENPLSLNLEMSQRQIDDLRTGWDLILDIDCKFLEYSKIGAQLLSEALKFHNIHNFGIKFSGGSGFHIGVSADAFPKKIIQDSGKILVKEFFPQGPRIIAAYLKQMIMQPLATRILSMNSLREISESIGKSIQELTANQRFNPFSVLDIDTILIAPRHLFRMPYSLHERTMLSSIVIKPEQIASFHPAWAKPDRVYPKEYMPVPDENEADELLREACDWQAKQNQSVKDARMINNIIKKTSGVDEKRTFSDRFVGIKDLNESFYPPCIRNILQGMKQDGRKRALFILLNFFRSLHLDKEDIEKKIEEWNKKNYNPLKEGYIRTQLAWHLRSKIMLPPNCDKNYYNDIAVCIPDFLCGKTKNPVNYVLKKIRLAEQQAVWRAEEQQKEERQKSRRKKRQQ